MMQYIPPPPPVNYPGIMSTPPPVNYPGIMQGPLPVNYPMQGPVIRTVPSYAGYWQAAGAAPSQFGGGLEASAAWGRNVGAFGPRTVGASPVGWAAPAAAAKQGWFTKALQKGPSKGKFGAGKIMLPIAGYLGGQAVGEAIRPTGTVDPTWQQDIFGDAAAKAMAGGTLGWTAGGPAGAAVGAAAGAASGATEGGLRHFLPENVSVPPIGGLSMIDRLIGPKDFWTGREEPPKVDQAAVDKNVKAFAEQAPQFWTEAALAEKGIGPEQIAAQQFRGQQEEAVATIEPFLQQQAASAKQYADIIRGEFPEGAAAIEASAAWEIDQTRTLAYQWPYLQAQIQQQKQIDAIAQQIYQQAQAQLMSGQFGGGGGGGGDLAAIDAQVQTILPGG